MLQFEIQTLVLLSNTIKLRHVTHVWLTSSGTATRSPPPSRPRPSPLSCVAETWSASPRLAAEKPSPSCCQCSATSWTSAPWRRLKGQSVRKRCTCHLTYLHNNNLFVNLKIVFFSKYSTSTLLLENSRRLETSSVSLRSSSPVAAVIMTPTRELALQITKECKKFSKPLGLRVVCVYGGTGISEQVNTKDWPTGTVQGSPWIVIIKKKKKKILKCDS